MVRNTRSSELQIVLYIKGLTYVNSRNEQGARNLPGSSNWWIEGVWSAVAGHRFGLAGLDLRLSLTRDRKSRVGRLGALGKMLYLQLQLRRTKVSEGMSPPRPFQEALPGPFSAFSPCFC